jgi:hypothetical protein
MNFGALMKTYRLLACALSTASLIACGGGESGDSGAHGNGGGGATGSGGASGVGGSGTSTGATTSGGFEPAGGGKLEDCAPYAEGHDLDVCTMTYLTDGADDAVGATAVHPDGAVLYAGSLRADDYGVDPVTLLGGGAAGVLRLSPDGRVPLTVTRLGERVNDVAVNASAGTIVASGSFGVVALDATAQNLLWSDELGGSAGTHVATGTDGTVAVAHGNAVSVFDAAGEPLGTFSIGESTSFADIALDTTHQLVFATGYKQRDVSGKCLGKYKAGYLRAFDYQGTLAWKNYDWSAAEVHDAGQCSDTTGRGLSMGPDGKLYYVGTSDGGNTVHQNDPKDLSQSAGNVKPDKYQDAWGLSGAKTIGFFARLEPTTGDLITSTMLLTRLSSDPNAGNSARPVTIAADAAGNVLVGGGSACCVPDGAEKTVNGATRAYPDAYLGGGMILVMSPDFLTRRTWMGVRGALGNHEEVKSVAIGSNGAWVALTEQAPSKPENLITDAPLLTFDAAQAEPGGGSADAHLTVFRGPN